LWNKSRGSSQRLAVSETFLVVVDDLVVPNADAGVTVLKEPVGVDRNRSVGFMVTIPRLKALSG
jgi:hypothetical protein